MFAQPDVGIRRFAMVAEQDGHVVGFAMAGPNRLADGGDAELFAIYLLADAQGLGVGRRLFTTAAQSLHRAGFQSLIVWVLDGNPAARFYERMGGRRIAEKTLMIGLQTCAEVGYGWPDLTAFAQNE
jgi:GNAT superfamily N-acetyltransferase